MGKADICTPVPACATTGFPDANRDHVDDNCEAGWRLSCVAGTWRDGNSQGPSLGAIFPGLALDGLEAAADVALPGVGGFLVQGGELVADFLDSASSMPPIFASSQVVPNYARAQVVYTKDANGKVAALRYLKLQATKVPSPTGGKQRVVAAVRIWDLYNPATVYFQSKVTKFGVYVETPGVDVMVPAKVIRLPAGGIPLPVDAWPVMTLMTRFDEGMNSRDPWCATSSLLGFYPVLTRDLAPQFANAESYLTPYIASEIRNPSYYSDGTTLYYPFYYSKPLSWYSFANYLKDLTLNDGNIQAVDTGDKHICLHMGADLSHSWDIGCDANPMFCAGTCDLAHQQCTNSLGTGCTSDPDCDFGECLPVNVAYAERFWPPIYPQNRLYACDASNLVRDPPYSRVADPFPNPADPLNPSDVPMVKQCIVDKDYSDAASITADRFSPVGAHAWYSVPEGTPPDPPDALIYYVYASPPLLADPNEADTLGLQYSTTWLPAGNGW
jgi:hypothetical protein